MTRSAFQACMGGVLRSQRRLPECIKKAMKRKVKCRKVRNLLDTTGRHFLLHQGGPAISACIMLNPQVLNPCIFVLLSILSSSGATWIYANKMGRFRSKKPQVELPRPGDVAETSSSIPASPRPPCPCPPWPLHALLQPSATQCCTYQSQKPLGWILCQQDDTLLPATFSTHKSLQMYFIALCNGLQWSSSLCASAVQ